jgi:hydrogenase maturation protease
MRDLDFGRQVIECLQQLDWPDGVVVEDLSCSAPLVLHRLQELRPAKVVLLGAVGRDVDPPATLRRYRLDLTARGPSHDRGTDDLVTEMADLDHTLAMARHWGGLPTDTVVIEVEPAEASPGLGFSDELAACFDPILDMVREELAGLTDGTPVDIDFDPAGLLTGPPQADGQPAPPAGPPTPSEAMSDLLGYAEDHAHARLQRHRAPALLDQRAFQAAGVDVAGRMRPWGVFVDSGGDWFDVIPLAGGALAFVVGDVEGRGVEVAGAMSDLRAAVRACAVLDGESPSGLMRQLDRLAEATGQGRDASLLYLTLQPASGEIRFANAGGCPPLLVDEGAPGGRFLDGARSGPLGTVSGAERPEKVVTLAAGSSLLLFTDGLVESRDIPRAMGLERLRRAATGRVAAMESLCDHVLAACTEDLRRDDDICLLGVRLGAGAVASPAKPEHRSHR